MNGNDIDADKTTFKVRLQGEDYHPIVIDWKDTSRPYKQQVFRQLAEISGIPIERHYRLCWYTSLNRIDEFVNMEADAQNISALNGELEFNKERVMQLMDGNEYFGLQPNLGCREDDHKNLNIIYAIVPERLIDETECTFNFCHHTATRTYLNQLKKIITNDDLRSQLKESLVPPVVTEDDILLDYQWPWFQTFRRFNINQFYIGNCHCYDSYYRLILAEYNYVAPQMYLRYRG